MGSAEDSRFRLGCTDHGAPVQLRGSGLSRSSASVGLGAGAPVCRSITQQDREGAWISSRVCTTGGRGEAGEREQSGAQSSEPLTFGISCLYSPGGLML